MSKEGVLVLRDKDCGFTACLPPRSDWYAFWPPPKEVTRLIVVGKSAIDKVGQEYLRRLNERFSLPIEYEQIAV